MKRQTNLADPRSGVAIIEFTLSLFVLVPLLLGIFVYGFRLVDAVEMDQITRDVGRMYSRGINFRNAGPISNAQTMASGFNLSAAPNGTSVLIFSTVRICQQSDCDAANAPSPAGGTCANLGKLVFTEQVTLGNPNMGASGFGTPPLNGVSPTYSVSVADFGKNTAAQAGPAFTALFTGVTALNPGEYAYVAEMWNKTPQLQIANLTGQPFVYARAIF